MLIWLQVYKQVVQPTDLPDILQLEQNKQRGKQKDYEDEEK